MPVPYPYTLIMSIMISLNTLTILALMTLFCLKAIRKQQSGWLIAAVTLNLLLYFAFSVVFPHEPTLSTTLLIHTVHLGVFVASVAFFLKAKPYTEADGTHRKMTWHNPTGGAWLTLFAVSGLAMHAALFLLAFLVWLQYPDGATAILPARLWSLYTLNPIYWYGTQLLLMGAMAWHRYVAREPMTVFSLAQLQAVFFLCLIWFFLFILNIYRIIPMIIRYFLGA